MKTESNIYPKQISFSPFNKKKNFVEFVDMNSIEEIQREEETIYRYNSYTFYSPATKEYIEDNFDVLFAVVKQKEYDDLAELIREKRNKLLDESDKYMAIDRLNLDTSSALKFLASLTNIFKNSYATYRQELRDITKQEGFPYDVVFPEKPE